jgi:hypothetical protein
MVPEICSLAYKRARSIPAGGQAEWCVTATPSWAEQAGATAL